MWTAGDINALGDLLCKYEHRFSHHSTDLEHVTVDPFSITQKRRAPGQTTAVNTPLC